MSRRLIKKLKKEGKEIISSVYVHTKSYSVNQAKVDVFVSKSIIAAFKKDIESTVYVYSRRSKEFLPVTEGRYVLLCWVDLKEQNKNVDDIVYQVTKDYPSHRYVAVVYNERNPNVIAIGSFEKKMKPVVL